MRLSNDHPGVYHDVDIVLHGLAWGDHVTVEEREPGGVTIVGMEDQPDNLVRRALALAASVVGGPPAVTVQLIKEVPVASGLGGGSADAAAVLRWCMERWPQHAATLARRAGELGADVPFLVHPTAARATGRGDKLTWLPPLPGVWAVLAHPGLSVPTAAVYRAYDMVGPSAPPSAPIAVDAIKAGVIPSLLGNQLEGAAVHVVPALREFRELLMRAGAPARRTVLSGSGGTYVTLSTDRQEAEALAEGFRRHRVPWIRVVSLMQGGVA